MNGGRLRLQERLVELRGIGLTGTILQEVPVDATTTDFLVRCTGALYGEDRSFAWVSGSTPSPVRWYPEENKRSAYVVVRVRQSSQGLYEVEGVVSQPLPIELLALLTQRKSNED